MKFLQKPLLILTLIFVLLGESPGGKTALASDGDGSAPEGLTLWGGVDLGLGLLSTSIAGEVSKSGYSLSPKLLASWYCTRWAFDLGAGLWLNRVSGTRANGTEINIQHTSGYFELGVRRLFLENWEAGLFAAFVLGEDLSFKPTAAPIVAGESARSSFLLFGAQALYRFHISEDWLVRVGARLSTDGNLPDRQYTTVQGVVHIGFPLNASDPVPRMEQAGAIKNTLEEESSYIQEESIILSMPRIEFEVAASRLSQKSRSFLLELGKFLGQNPGEWGMLTVQGHTDSTGDPTKNRRLSENRAENVMNALAAGGAPRKKLRSVGFGQTRLLDLGNSDEAHEKNRRVEFHLSRDSTLRDISKEVTRLRRKYRL